MDNYNAIAENYNDSEQNAITLWHLGYRVVTELLGDVNGKSILDYGCGTGTFCRYIQSKGAKVTGVDVSENMINVARSRSSDQIEYHSIPSGMEFPENFRFDFVVSNFVLCTLSFQNQILEILGEIYRVLKKDGLFVLMNSNWDKSNGKEFNSFRLEYCSTLVPGHPVTAVIKTDPLIRLHDYFWPIAEYQQMMITSGFKIKGIREEIAESNDEGWLDEKKFPPYYALSAVK